MDRQEEEDFAALLRKMDSSAGRATIHGTVSEILGRIVKGVKGVSFTHLHIDHTQGIRVLCNARGDGAVLQSGLTSAGFASSDGSSLYQSNEFPGLAAFELGDHAPGSILRTIGLGDGFYFSQEI